MKSESERGLIGAWLVRERERQHLSAAQVAERAGIPEASYRAIEAGRWRPTPPRLEALERVIGAQAPDMTKEPPPPWAKALVEEEVPAIRSGVDALVRDLASLRTTLEAIQEANGLEPRDPADGREPAKPDTGRGR